MCATVAQAQQSPDNILDQITQQKKGGAETPPFHWNTKLFG